MYWTILTVFSFEDVNENGTYESGIDTKQYAQTLPFQAGVVVEIQQYTRGEQVVIPPAKDFWWGLVDR